MCILNDAFVCKTSGGQHPSAKGYVTYHTATVHSITAVQSEWSVFSRDIEHAVVPYSPLGRGLLTGTLTSIDDLADNDFRRSLPRWQAGNLTTNLELVNQLRSIATRHAATPGQVALAWVLAQGQDVVPIPGTKHRRYLQENLNSLKLTLTPEDVHQLSTLHPLGDRYPDMSWVNRDTIPLPN